MNRGVIDALDRFTKDYRTITKRRIELKRSGLFKCILRVVFKEGSGICIWGMEY